MSALAGVVRPAPVSTTDEQRGPDMEPARRDLHWQPLDATEREALFDRVDAFLAARARARQLPLLPDAPVRTAEPCPDCDSPTLWQGARSKRGGRSGAPTAAGKRCRSERASPTRRR